MTEPLETRKKNLKMLVAQWEGPTNLARKIGQQGPSYISQMLGGHRPITGKTARKIEEKLGLESGWMDKEHTDGRRGARPADVDVSTMSQVVSLLGASLEEEGVKLPPPKFAEVVALLYEHAIQAGVLDEGYMQRIVNLVK
jgi:hypothetical protein